VFRYDASTLELLEEIPVDSTTNGQGWGICFVPKEGIFYVSDGTHYLHQWNASTLELMDTIPVTFRDSVEDVAGQERDYLNELEYDVHSNTILANVWDQNYIVRINPATGFITHRYDLTALDRYANTDVLNGIAITDVPNEIWVTGKYWPVMYRIRLID
jgi:glutamine cyclotransferase